MRARRRTSKKKNNVILELSAESFSHVLQATHPFTRFNCFFAIVSSRLHRRVFSLGLLVGYMWSPPVVCPFAPDKENKWMIQEKKKGRKPCQTRFKFTFHLIHWGISQHSKEFWSRTRRCWGEASRASLCGSSNIWRSSFFLHRLLCAWQLRDHLRPISLRFYIKTPSAAAKGSTAAQHFWRQIRQ